MKKKISFLSFVLAFTVLPFFTISCKDDTDNPRDIEVFTPAITSISPDSGESNTVITIAGSDFGTDPSQVEIRFNTTSAPTAISVTNTEIQVEAPPGFSDQTVNVRVSVKGQTSNAVTFYYINTTPPSITSVTATAFTGSTVVISGNNFSAKKEDNIVKFGDIKAIVTAATETSLTVIAPDLGSVTSINVTVTKFDMVSNAERITIDIDQNKIATYNWTTHTLKPGVVYKNGQFTLFGSITRRIHVLDVTLDASSTLGIGFSTTYANTVTMCNNYGAIAGINAGYFPFGTASDKDPYIRIDGVKIQDGHLGVSQIFTNSALIINNNVVTVRKFTESGTSLNQVAAAIPLAQAQNIIVSGPMLITDGVIENLNMAQSHNSSSTARTGLGVSADGKRVFMVVVDYNQGTTGVTTPQLAKILQALGAVNAMNFDGGGSSTMFVQGQGTDGRVSKNGSSMRSVRSVIYLK